MAPEPLAALGRRAKAAARNLATATTSQKNDALDYAAEALIGASGEVLAANAHDVARAETAGGTEAIVDRLRLSEARLDEMAGGLRAVAALADPVGEVVEGWTLPNGLAVRRVRVPLGVVGIVYENRPNVTSDAAGLCVKSGNAALLRGSAGAIASNVAIAGALRSGIAKAGLPADCVAARRGHPARDGRRVRQAARRDRLPRAPWRTGARRARRRSGDGAVRHRRRRELPRLRRRRRPTSTSPSGSSSTRRPSGPGVCNAMETLIVHRAMAPAVLPRLARALEGVELVGDEAARAVLPGIGVATDEDFATEFLRLKLAIAVVDDLDGALEHIARYSTGHSEAIVTRDYEAARRFTREVDAAAVLVNASTRFVDGGELGLGAEIGISTQKLHARGPMGLRELTSVKFVIEGDGQVRS